MTLSLPWMRGLRMLTALCTVCGGVTGMPHQAYSPTLASEEVVYRSPHAKHPTATEVAAAETVVAAEEKTERGFSTSESSWSSIETGGTTLSAFAPDGDVGLFESESGHSAGVSGGSQVWHGAGGGAPTYTAATAPGLSDQSAANGVMGEWAAYQTGAPASGPSTAASSTVASNQSSSDPATPNAPANPSTPATTPSNPPLDKPVPAPDSMVMLVTGMLALTTLRRRRR